MNLPHSFRVHPPKEWEPDSAASGRPAPVRCVSRRSRASWTHGFCHAAEATPDQVVVLPDGSSPGVTAARCRWRAHRAPGRTGERDLPDDLGVEADQRGQAGQGGAAAASLTVLGACATHSSIAMAENSRTTAQEVHRAALVQRRPQAPPATPPARARRPAAATRTRRCRGCGSRQAPGATVHRPPCRRTGSPRPR